MEKSDVIVERACVAPSVVLVINDNPCGLIFALRYSCRSCPSENIEFMCWALEDYMMINALFLGLYEEWSSVELSILQVWLGKGVWVNFHVYLQAIIYIKRRWSASSIWSISEDIIWLKLAMETWRRSLASLSIMEYGGAFGDVFIKHVLASTINKGVPTWEIQDLHHLAQVECARKRYDLDRVSILPVSCC